MNKMESHLKTNSMANSMNSGALICTLITGICITKLKLDNIYYGLLYSIILNFINYILSNYNEINLTYIFEQLILFDSKYISILIVFSISIFILYIGFNKLNDLFYKEISINIYDPQQINIIRSYQDFFPQYFNKPKNINIGDRDLILEYKICDKSQRMNYDQKLMSITNSDENIPIHFNDLNLNIKGYFIWKKDLKIKELPNKDSQKIDNQNLPVKNTIALKYLEIYITKFNKKINNAEKYIKYLNKAVSEKFNEEKNITLYYYKLLTFKGENKFHSAQFYTGAKDQFIKKEKQLIYSFFHQERDHLWNLIKNIALNPSQFTNFGQAARINLLLYGPPGTGKSTFAYRIASCLNRHIMSIDLRDINSKFELYKIIQKPEVYLDNSYEKNIIMFEEFDISIQELQARTKLKQKKENLWLKFMASRIEADSNFYSNDNNKNKDQNKDKDKNQNKDKDKNKEKNKDKDNDSDIDEDDDEFKNTSPSNKEEFSIRDLLEIFQGPIPFDGMIMIATTNKYDVIKNICPELFRPGRITPVYFGYINKDTLQEISTYFFNRKLQCYIPDQITIPTSQIIELALEANSQKSTKNEHFLFFQNKLDKLL